MDNEIILVLSPYTKQLSELQAAAFSIIQEGDPYRTAKQLHLKNWCRAFVVLFVSGGAEPRTFNTEHLPFFLDVLSDEGCWEETNTIHRVNFNRRIAAKKVVQSFSRSGIPNPLDYDLRYRVACWCCLEEDILGLFEYFKQNSGIMTDDAAELNKLVGKKLSRGQQSEPLTIYWSYIMGGLASELQSESKHLLEYGLELVFRRYVITYVEAVEYFCNKIKSLSENEFSNEQKYKIIEKTVEMAAKIHTCQFPEVFEYCNRQLSPNMYPEFIRREHEVFLDGLFVLMANLCFDQFKKVFDCFDPTYISEDKYCGMLNYLIKLDYSENYTSEAVDLFMHMWRKGGFDKHRSFVLTSCIGDLLLSLVKKNFIDLVWAVMDKASSDQITKFMNSPISYDTISELHQIGDKDLIKKFLSYYEIVNYVISLLAERNYLSSLNNSSSQNNVSTQFENPSTSCIEVNVNSETANNVESKLLQTYDQHSINISSDINEIKDAENPSTSCMEVNVNTETANNVESKLLQTYDQHSINISSDNNKIKDAENQTIVV